MPWNHIWFCLNTDPRLHNGCNDLLWLQDIYDYVTGFPCLAIIIAVPFWIAYDEWKERNANRSSQSPDA